jgi:hypothetical protein
MTKGLIIRLKECAQYHTYPYAPGAMKKLHAMGLVEPSISHFMFVGYRITDSGVAFLKKLEE